MKAFKLYISDMELDMNDNVDSQILICKVSYNWYQVIKSNFISNGSSVTNCWYTPFEEFAHDKDDEELPPPGSLVLFLVEKDGEQIICGGGFFLKHLNLDITSCWNEYGVLSGYMTLNDFLKRAKEFKADMNDPLSCYIADGSFIFIRKNMVHVPDMFRINFEDRSRITIPSDEPFGMFIKKVCLERRKAQIDPSSCTWPGIYYVASVHKSAEQASQYRTKLLSVYGFKCAVTGCTLMPALSVAHIKTIYDDRYLNLNNGVILRSDIHHLFSKGYLTFFYDDDGLVRVKISKNMKLNLDPEYSELDGKKITLPENKDYWPDKDYLKWHNHIRFENWLKYGEFSLIDALPMHPREG